MLSAPGRERAAGRLVWRSRGRRSRHCRSISSKGHCRWRRLRACAGVFVGNIAVSRPKPLPSASNRPSIITFKPAPF